MYGLSAGFLLYTVVLLGLSVGVLYPVYRYSNRVIHPYAIRLVSVSTLLLAIGEIANRLHYVVASDALHTGTTILLTYAAWRFAREFVCTTPRELELLERESFDQTTKEGGFEDDASR